MVLGTICLKDKKQKNLFYLVRSTTLLCVYVHTTEVQATVLILSWCNLINSSASAIVLSPFSFIQLILGLTCSKNAHIQKKTLLLESFVNDLGATMLLLCWCCFLAMQIWTWPLQNVKEAHRCVAILISGEEQVYFRKINCREGNNLRNKKKKIRQRLPVQWKQRANKGTWRRGLDLWLWDK